MVDAKISTAVLEIEEYKNYVTTKFTHYSTVTEKKFTENDDKIQSSAISSVIIENNFVSTSRRLDTLELQATFNTSGTAPPQTFNMATPAQTQHQQQPQ